MQPIVALYQVDNFNWGIRESTQKTGETSKVVEMRARQLLLWKTTQPLIIVWNVFHSSCTTTIRAIDDEFMIHNKQRKQQSTSKLNFFNFLQSRREVTVRIYYYLHHSEVSVTLAAAAASISNGCGCVCCQQIVDGGCSSTPSPRTFLFSSFFSRFLFFLFLCPFFSFLGCFFLS